jgi:prepilin-type N-terminal cleavage/methylation domain-containing protein
MKRKNSLYSFTLIELLAAIVILSILFLSFSYVFISTNKITSLNKSLPHEKIAQAAEIMRKDISTAFYRTNQQLNFQVTENENGLFLYACSLNEQIQSFSKPISTNYICYVWHKPSQKIFRIANENVSSTWFSEIQSNISSITNNSPLLEDISNLEIVLYSNSETESINSWNANNILPQYLELNFTITQNSNSSERKNADWNFQIPIHFIHTDVSNNEY